MSVERILSALAEAWHELFTEENVGEEYAKEATQTVLTKCGPRIVRRLADGRYHGMMGFAEDSRCIPDWVIEDALGYDLSEQDVLYNKYYIVRVGLSSVVNRR